MSPFCSNPRKIHILISNFINQPDFQLPVTQHRGNPTFFFIPKLWTREKGKNRPTFLFSANSPCEWALDGWRIFANPPTFHQSLSCQLSRLIAILYLIGCWLFFFDGARAFCIRFYILLAFYTGAAIGFHLDGRSFLRNRWQQMRCIK